MEVSEWLSIEVAGVGQMDYTPPVLGGPVVGCKGSCLLWLDAEWLLERGCTERATL